MNLPIDKDTQRTGRRAADFVSLWLQENDIIVRREEQSTDFGIDLELELHEGPFASGLLVKCQVKGTSGPAFSAGDTEYVTIKSSTQNYWATLPLNVMCILCDVSTGAIYWQAPSAILTETEYTSLRFTKSMQADRDWETFKSALARLAQAPTSSQILSLVPACLNLFSDFSRGVTSVYDRGFEVESDIDGAVRVFYEHLERLCIYTGMEQLPARWIQWERRNAIIQTELDSSDSGLLDGNLVGEIIRYAAPFYAVALSRVARCVDPDRITETNPVLAGMLMEGMFDEDSVASAFKKLESGEPLLFESRAHYSFGMAPTSDDVDFGEDLAKRNVHFYRFPSSEQSR